MTDVVVMAALPLASIARPVLAAACRAVGVGVRLELFGSGSLFQRLRSRRTQPPADVVLWFGPYAAQTAAAQGLLQPHQPAALPEHSMHHPSWLWSSVDFQPFRASGAVPISSADDLASVPRLALADPERAESGLMLLLATLDRARQVEADPEQAWTWWARRVQTGTTLADDDDGALTALRGRATHAVTLGDRGTPLVGLAPVPDAVALAANAPNADAGRRLIDWLVGPDATPSSRLSGWRASTDGLQDLRAAAPALDIEWCTQQYGAARRRWAQSGFGPRVEIT